MSKRIYIAGKVTGLQFDEVYHRFFLKEQELMERGYDPWNPVRMVLDWLGGQPATWEIIMRFCLQGMMGCDEVYMLHGWEDSKGAVLEHKLAQELAYEITYEAKPMYFGLTAKDLYN